MHDGRRFNTIAMGKRLALSALLAVMLAVGLTAATAPVAWNPLCAAYTPDDIEWWLLFCYLDPPPKDPRT